MKENLDNLFGQIATEGLTLSLYLSSKTSLGKLPISNTFQRIFSDKQYAGTLRSCLSVFLSLCLSISLSLCLQKEPEQIASHQELPKNFFNFADKQYTGILGSYLSVSLSVYLSLSLFKNQPEQIASHLNFL